MRKGGALWHALGQGLSFRWHLSLIMIKGCFLCVCVSGMSGFIGLDKDSLGKDVRIETSETSDDSHRNSCSSCSSIFFCV